MQIEQKVSKTKEIMVRVEISNFFIFVGSKITVNGDYSHEIKRCLLLRRKAVTNLDSVLKSRDITLPTNVRIVKARVTKSWTQQSN